MVKGWTFKTVVQGSSVPQVFIPRMIQLWKDGRLPFEKFVNDYTLDEINHGFEDSKSTARRSNRSYFLGSDTPSSLNKRR